MNKRIAYAIPNLFTAGSLISALVALNMASIGSYVQSAWLITLSILLDGMDGKMARVLHATSRIGAQADSLADFVAFGVVPGFLAWQVSLKNFGFIGFMVFIFYILCGGYRLARFNVLSQISAPKENFMGLPIPAAAAAVSSFILFNEIILKDYSANLILMLIMFFMGWLMISRVPYIAVNKTKKKKKQLSPVFVIVTAVAILAIKHTVWVYLVCIWIYVFYGLFNKSKAIIISQHAKHIYIKNKKGL